MEEERAEVIPEARHRGPNLGALGVVYTLLFLGSLIVTAIMTGGHFPSPFEAPGTAQAFFREHANAVRIAAFLQFGAAIPLGIFAATVASRLQFLGIKVAGVFITLFGGLAASLFAAISALLQWGLGDPGVASQPAMIRALHVLAFATGGVGFVVPLGLLMAAISVICWFTKFLPRWLVWLGLLLAVAAELSSLSLVFNPAAFLLPVARFLGFVWIIAAGFMLPRSRAETQRARSRQAA
jgi:hypothetical protein